MTQMNLCHTYTHIHICIYSQYSWMAMHGPVWGWRWKISRALGGLVLGGLEPLGAQNRYCRDRCRVRMSSREPPLPPILLSSFSWRYGYIYIYIYVFLFLHIHFGPSNLENYHVIERSRATTAPIRPSASWEECRFGIESKEIHFSHAKQQRDSGIPLLQSKEIHASQRFSRLFWDQP